MSSVTKDYFYVRNCYDHDIRFLSFNNYTANPAMHFHRNSLTRLVLAILLRIGFVLVQIGSVPMNNINLILLQNAVDLCCITVMFFLTGFPIAYNGDLASLIGKGYWIGDATIDKNEAMVGWQAVIIASAIYTSAVVGRMHTIGYLLVSVLLSGFVQPLLIHWAWTAEGWMTDNELGGRKVVFKDYAGAGVVHVVGGFSGFIGCLVLGRRILRLRDLDDASINSGSAGAVFGGLLLIFIGLQGLCMNTHRHDRLKIFGWDLSHAYVNNLLAGSSCSLLIVALHFIFSRKDFNHWTVMRCVQGTVAGVVIVSAATNDYSPQVAIVLGCLGGIVFYLISRQVFSSALEDYCNIIALHLSCAIFGSVLAPLGAIQFAEDTTVILMNFFWQFICLIALLALVGTVILPMFIILEYFGILRNRSEYLNHIRANAVVNNIPPRTFLQRLFFPDIDCLYLQPSFVSNKEYCSNIDSRFSKYQTEIDKLEKERSTVTIKQFKNTDNDENVTQIKTPDARIQRARQMHTLSTVVLEMTKDRKNIGKSTKSNPVNIRKKHFLGKEINYILEPIEEIDEEISIQFEVNESRLQYNIEGNNIKNKNSIWRPNFGTFEKSEISEECDYRLRRTEKLMNLHCKFNEEDLKVILGPKHVDSSCSNFYDADVYEKIQDMNEPVKNIAANDDSLVYVIS